MKTHDVGILYAWLFDSKLEATHLGRYPDGRRGVFWFDTRRQWMPRMKFKPFRCIAYNRIVTRIGALERILKADYEAQRGGGK